MRKPQPDVWDVLTRGAALITVASAIVSAVGSAVAWVRDAPTTTTMIWGAGVLVSLFAYVVVARDRWSLLVGARRAIESDAWLFVYGSLLDPRSLGRTIGRNVVPYHYKPAVLRTYRKVWGAPVTRINSVDSHWRSIEPTKWWSLAVIRDPGGNAECYGAVVAVSDEELALLCERESSYKQKNVTEFIHPIDRTSLGLLDRVRALMRSIVNPGWDTLPSHMNVYTFRLAATSAERGKLIREEYLRIVRLGHRRFILPDDIPPLPSDTRNAFDADVKFGDLWAATPAYELIERRTLLYRYLRDKRCLRNNPEAEQAIRTLPRPIVLSARTHRLIRDIAEATVQLSANALNYVLSKDDLLEEYQLSSEEAELARQESQGSGLLPQIARVDFIVNREQIKVLEVNCDSPAGMAHFDAIANWYRYNREHWWRDRCELVLPEPHGIKKALTAAIQKRWEEFSGATEPPSIAIVERDPGNKPARSEFDVFRQFFAESFGVDASSPRFCVCEPEDLHYVDGRLVHRASRIPINVVYKRILWQELQESGPRAQEFVKAYRDGKTCVVNSLRSRLMGNKRFLVLMTQMPSIPEVWKGLDPGRLSQYLPWVEVFKDVELRARVSQEQRRWILKSYRGFAAKEVIVGDRMDPDEWRRDVDKAFDARRYVAQRVYRHGRVHVPIINITEITPRNLVCIVGAYLVNGECVGLEAKATVGSPVSMSPPHGGFRTIVISPQEERE